MPPDGASPRKTRNYGPVLIVEDDAVLALAVEDALIEAGTYAKYHTGKRAPPRAFD